MLVPRCKFTGSNAIEGAYNIFSLFYAVVKIAFINARIIVSLDYISAVQYVVHFIYHFVRCLLIRGTFELTNDQLPSSVAS